MRSFPSAEACSKTANQDAQRRHAGIGWPCFWLDTDHTKPKPSAPASLGGTRRPAAKTRDGCSLADTRSKYAKTHRTKYMHSCRRTRSRCRTIQALGGALRNRQSENDGRTHRKTTQPLRQTCRATVCQGTIHAWAAFANPAAALSAHAWMLVGEDSGNRRTVCGETSGASRGAGVFVDQQRELQPLNCHERNKQQCF